MDAVKNYHETAKAYRQSLKDAWSDYEKGYKAIERYKGGESYEADLAKLQDKRDAAIKAAKDKARQSFTSTIKYMRKAIEAQPATVPTAEQMAMLNALKMRESVEADEIVKAAEQMRGVDMAVHVLDEVARKSGKRNLVDEYMGAAGRASRGVDHLADNANLLLKLDRPDSIKQRHQANHVRKWGGEWDERHEGVSLTGDSNSYALSAVDRDFKDERETICELADVGDHYAEFRSTVNYSKGIKPGLQELWGEV